MAKVSYEFDLTEFLETKEARGKKREIKQAVGSFLVNAVIDDMNNSTSSVTGRRFKSLDKDYVDLKKSKGGSGSPDLELFGDLKDSITFKQTDKGVEIGVFGGVNALKAETHNWGTQDDIVPRRPFIPKKGDSGLDQFRPQIRKEVVDLIKEIIGESDT